MPKTPSTLALRQTMLAPSHPLTNLPDYSKNNNRQQQQQSITVLTKSPCYTSNAVLWSAFTNHKINHCQDKEELLARLEAETTEFIILDDEHSQARLLDNIKRLQPSVRFIFLLEEKCPEKLIRLLNRGHQFEQLPYHGEAGTLTSKLMGIIFPRKEPRLTIESATLYYETHENHTKHWRNNLIDISNNGLSWRIKQDTHSHYFLPESTIHNLRIEKNNRIIFSAPQAVIKHLSNYVAKGAIGHYKVGAQLINPTKDTSHDKTKLFDSPLTVSALLKQALSKADIQLNLIEQPNTYYQGTWKNNSKDLLTLTGTWPDEWQIGTILCCTFELNNWDCEFHSVITAKSSRQDITLQMPTNIKCVQRPSLLRQQPQQPSTIQIQISIPYSNAAINIRPLEISIEGLSFQTDLITTPLPCGTLLNLILFFGTHHRAMSCNALVRSSCIQRKNGLQINRYDLEFQNLSQQQLLNNILINEKYDKVHNGQGMKLDKLWGFFHDSNFIYPKKEESMVDVIGDVKETFSKLIQAKNSPILKTIISNSEDSSIETHTSLLHAYSDTWYIQHLASTGVKNGNKLSVRDTYLGTIDTLINTDNAQWLRAYFQPQKKTPDTAVGIFARRTQDKNISTISNYAYLSSPCSHIGHHHHFLTIREAGNSDFQYIEKYFINNDILIEFRAEDGYLDELHLESMQKEYQSNNLHRRREVVIAEHNGTVCGFALLEFSSFGLNLSEVTNSCTIHTWDQEALAVTALASHARNRYRQQGHPFCIIMVKPKYAPLLTPLGFNYSRDYTCWTLHRNLFPEYADYIERLFNRKA